MGLGTDGFGSIRLPSHFCGIAGLKPTSGRIPFTGLLPPAFGASAKLRHVGPMARYVEDLILTLPILAGVDWRDPATIPMPLEDPRKVELKDLRAAFYTDNGGCTAAPAVGGNDGHSPFCTTVWGDSAPLCNDKC